MASLPFGVAMWPGHGEEKEPLSVRPLAPAAVAAVNQDRILWQVDAAKQE